MPSPAQSAPSVSGCGWRAASGLGSPSGLKEPTLARAPLCPRVTPALPWPVRLREGRALSLSFPYQLLPGIPPGDVQGMRFPQGDWPSLFGDIPLHPTGGGAPTAQRKTRFSVVLGSAQVPFGLCPRGGRVPGLRARGFPLLLPCSPRQTLSKKNASPKESTTDTNGAVYSSSLGRDSCFIKTASISFLTLCPGPIRRRGTPTPSLRTP